jgi:aminomethyltransferase
MKTTRLYSSQKKLGAKMIEFFGWSLPVEFSGIIEETNESGFVRCQSYG